MDEEIREALQELEKVLLDAVTSSAAAAQALRRLREEGFSVYLAVDRGDLGDTEDFDPRRPLQLAMKESSSDAAPRFRIDRNDFNFLRSIGIDPTPGGERSSKRS